ncbi:MAG: acetate kinase [Clostridia bacterium]|nr:acetate kinase [Clostridia bacterium]
MKVLVINAGSSSLKYQVFDMSNESVLAKGNCEKIGIAGSFIKYKANGVEKTFEGNLENHTQALKNVIEILTNSEYGVLKSLNEIDAVGHRVLHGGEIFKQSVVITPEILATLETLIPLGPLHMPANISGVKACQELFENKPQVAVFDTAFHAQMPQKAFMYAIPYEAYEKWNIRRYGFHGTSHRYVSGECARLMNKDIKDVKIITCHLGNGSSISAVAGGHSVDTSMGLTPLAGILMGTRSGDIDPSILEAIQDKTGWTLKEITTYLNKKSGVLGMNGVSSDMRDNDAEIAKGNKRAQLVYDMLAYQIKKYIGAYTAAMGGVDAIVFTGGVGENDATLRENVLSGLEYLGVEIDKDFNKTMPRGTTQEISTKNSKVKVYRIPTDEELVIARDAVALM